MASSGDHPSAQAIKRATRLTLPGGLMLALCVFLPIAEGCGEQIYPHDIPPLLWPYVIGALIVAGSLVLRNRSHTGSVLVRAFLQAVGMLASGSLVVLFIITEIWLFAFIFLPLLALILTSFTTADWGLPRAMWCTGALCVVWFGLMFVLGILLPGVVISLIGSILITLGGFQAEWAVRAHRA